MALSYLYKTGKGWYVFLGDSEGVVAAKGPFMEARSAEAIGRQMRRQYEAAQVEAE